MEWVRAALGAASILIILYLLGSTPRLMKEIKREQILTRSVQKKYEKNSSLDLFFIVIATLFGIVSILLARV
ncbi:hypothetical protein [Halobacillus yeomjeoni]|uniref:Uncharacterized protein n=1 Tax=Halobacillus yeomjeoni TaxID=311194 RepID=A0A931MWL0_9BACI|nr:hypothetical protein [Halobacillus yeomjeoni]MBH0231404.1 hypothetical protein [Halobacillus yeomjeoni]